MSLFGENAPKYISSGTTVDLTYFRVTKDEPEYFEEMDQSKVSGDRVWIRNKYHWVFEGVYHLDKETNPYTKYQVFVSDLNTNVTLYRHNDGIAFKDSDGDLMPFRLVRVDPFYIQDDRDYDAVLLRFVSTGFVDISKSVTIEEVAMDDLDQIPMDDLDQIAET